MFVTSLQQLANIGIGDFLPLKLHADFVTVKTFPDGDIVIDYVKAEAVMEVFEAILQMLARDRSQ